MEAQKMFSRTFKIIKEFFPLFIIAGFINIWGYLKWIGRLDVFPLIINNVSGVVAVLITSLIFFSVFSMTLLIPSALSSLSGGQTSKKTKLKIKYNEGCCAATALTAVVIALTLMFIEKTLSVWVIGLSCAALLSIHTLLNYRFNRQRQQHHRELIRRRKCIHSRTSGLLGKHKWAFRLAELLTHTWFINVFFTFIALIIAGVSFLPLIFLLQADVYFSGHDLLLQYVVIVIMYILLFLPVLLSLVTNQTKARYGIKPVLAFSPALVIAIFSIFSVQLIQINQRSIEIVGMASWHSQVFAFKKENFPAYYFPQNIWGVSKVMGAERMVEGIKAFSNGETYLICPKQLNALRDIALKNNAFTWQTDEKAKEKLADLSQYCLLAKSDQVRSGAALSTLFASSP
jgi:hypothetical protein